MVHDMMSIPEERLSSMKLGEKVDVIIKVSIPRKGLDKKLQAIPVEDYMKRIRTIREYTSPFLKPLLKYLGKEHIHYDENSFEGTVETVLTAQQIRKLYEKDYVADILEKQSISPS